jgi:hypothetical protein
VAEVVGVIRGEFELAGKNELDGRAVVVGEQLDESLLPRLK